ncbi:MAG TPA: hypothetical protein VKU60_04860, partial [Chloroflexota bacterium]|nr:hypothetical protein [Chloroflexota bacterium]
MAALILFEVIVVVIFGLLLVHQQRRELSDRLRRRLESQAFMAASQATMALEDDHAEELQRVVQNVAAAQSVTAAQITDLSGRTLASTDPTMVGKLALSIREKSFLRSLEKPEIFTASPTGWEAVAPIRVHGQLADLAWVYPNQELDRQDLRSLVNMTATWAVFVLLGCTAIAGVLAQSITRQLDLLTHATRRLVQDSEDTGSFPLPVKSATEAADLTVAFNRMVAAMADQRAGLNETLA